MLTTLGTKAEIFEVKSQHSLWAGGRGKWPEVKTNDLGKINNTMRRALFRDYVPGISFCGGTTFGALIFAVSLIMPLWMRRTTGVAKRR